MAAEEEGEAGGDTDTTLHRYNHTEYHCEKTAPDPAECRAHMQFLSGILTNGSFKELLYSKSECAQFSAAFSRTQVLVRVAPCMLIHAALARGRWLFRPLHIYVHFLRGERGVSRDKRRKGDK